MWMEQVIGTTWSKQAGDKSFYKGSFIAWIRLPLFYWANYRSWHFSILHLSKPSFFTICFFLYPRVLVTYHRVFSSQQISEERKQLRLLRRICSPWLFWSLLLSYKMSNSFASLFVIDLGTSTLLDNDSCLPFLQGRYSDFFPCSVSGRTSCKTNSATIHASWWKPYCLNSA